MDSSDWDDIVMDDGDIDWGVVDGIDKGWCNGDDDVKGDEHDDVVSAMSDDDVDAACMIQAAEPASSLQRQKSYIIMDGVTLRERQERLVKYTAELLFITKVEASCLLRHYSWQAPKLQTAWFNDMVKVRKECGVSVRLESDAAVNVRSRGDCMTAYCETDTSGTALACGHFFCDECWTSFLTSEVKHGRSCVFSSCMGISCTKDGCTHKFGCACSEMVPTAAFDRYVTDRTLVTKYHDWVLASFVEGQRKIKWCPRPNCDRAVECAAGTRTVTCSCGHQFCFVCGENSHTPAPCDLVHQWLVKERSDDATQLWLAARTKKCPKCSVHIEKNRACSHMHCTKCGHHFCWLCKGPWSEHGSSTGGYYVCNKYDDSAKKGQVSDDEKSILDNQRVLQKYTYYYKQYKNNAEAITLTERMWQNIEMTITTEDVSLLNVLGNAVAKLIMARCTLQYTFLMAYYLRSGKEKVLFEFQQEMLIQKTETLQEILDDNCRDLNKLTELRKSINDVTSSITKFTHEIINHVENGNFEALLLTQADMIVEQWGCTFCENTNRADAVTCTSCRACRAHNEVGCNACKA